MELTPKSKIVNYETEEYKSIKEETEKELRTSLDKLKHNIELLKLEDKKDVLFSHNRVMEIEQSIKDLHDYMTELDLDKIVLDEKIEELDMLQTFFKDLLLSISKDRLN